LSAHSIIEEYLLQITSQSYDSVKLLQLQKPVQITVRFVIALLRTAIVIVFSYTRTYRTKQNKAKEVLFVTMTKCFHILKNARHSPITTN